MKGIIYRWLCNKNRKSYIGQTINEEKREKDFLNIKKSYAGSKIDRARRKYGVSEGVWTKEVLKRLWCNDGKEDELRDRLNHWERYYIALYDSVNNGYNLTDGGDSNYVFSEDVIKRIRQKSIDYWNGLSSKEKEKHKIKSIEAYNKWYNNLTKEEKEKMHKLFVDSNLGLHRGHSLVSTSSNVNKIYKGKERSAETREKISKTLKERPTLCKKVYQYLEDKVTLNRTFDSIKEASEFLGIKSETLRVHIKSGQLYKGFYWVGEDKKTDNVEGCYWVKRLKRWRSRLRYNAKTYNLGHYENIEAASEIYQMAKKSKEEGKFEEWYYKLNEYKLKMYEKYGELTHK